MEHLRYPNESNEYRAARNALLNDEIALRAQIETVAAKRRAWLDPSTPFAIDARRSDSPQAVAPRNRSACGRCSSPSVSECRLGEHSHNSVSF